MASNFYAVRVGRKTGIFEDVKEYLSYTRGYPGAIGRGFKTLEKAQAFLNVETVVEPELEYVEGPLTGLAVTAYIDGSYDENTRKGAYGIVLRHKKKEVYLNGYIPHEAAQSKNVGAEFYAAIKALEYAQLNKCKSITIIHDLSTISAIVRNKAKARGYALEYKTVYDHVSKHVPVYFHKVDSHSSNKQTNQKYNNMADSLARDVLSLKTKRSLMDHIESVLLTTKSV